MFEMRPYAKRNNSLYNPFRDMDEFEKKFFSSPFGFFDTNVLDEFKTDIKDEGDRYEALGTIYNKDYDFWSDALREAELDRYELEADLPGFDKKDIHLDINGDMLTVSAERHSEHEEKDKKNKYVRCERSYGSYSRSFDLSGVKADEIKAKYENGVLKLTMPKKENTLPEARHLEIE